LVIGEEFGDWDNSKRRIDLLAIDKEANLVVIELKRTDDGGHMELQAIRYAAMVSTMTFDKAVEVYEGYLAGQNGGSNARESLLRFLEWQEPDDDRFAQDVRIVLVSAEFSKELTTAVMWLNERDLDVRCIRLKPYSDGGKVLLDVQQVIPLPESSEYQVQIREKARQERKDRAARFVDRERFWTALLNCARTKTSLHANLSPRAHHWLGTGSGVQGLVFRYVINQHATRVDLYVDRGSGRRLENKEIFDRLLGAQDQIEHVFGRALEWQRLDEQQASWIGLTLEGGYRDDEQQWPALHESLVDAMIRLERATRPHIAEIKASL
jgi:hypothetical protein